MNTVAENFNIDEDELFNNREESEYWEKAYAFFMDVKDEDTDDLSQSQMDWLYKIEKKMNE